MTLHARLSRRFAFPRLRATLSVAPAEYSRTSGDPLTGKALRHHAATWLLGAFSCTFRPRVDRELARSWQSLGTLGGEKSPNHTTRPREPFRMSAAQTARLACSVAYGVRATGHMVWPALAFDFRILKSNHENRK